MKHYLMTTEDDFSKAIGRLVEKAVQNPTHETDIWGEIRSAAISRSDSQGVARNDISPCHTRAYARSCDDQPRPAKIISGEDRNRTYPENTGNSSLSAEGGANSGAVADLTSLPPDLARIVAAWPTLPAAIQRAILALLDCQ